MLSRITWLTLAIVTLGGVAKTLKASPRVLNDKLKAEDKDAAIEGWHEWHHAYHMADSDSNDRITIDDIPALYREHFNKVMSLQAHASNPNAVVREETEVFLETAEEFQRFVKRSGSNVEEFSWIDFKKLMTNFMHVQADLLNARREL